MNRSYAALAGFLLSMPFAGMTIAQDLSDPAAMAVHDSIEDMHGDADGFDAAFEIVTEAFRFGDPTTIADLGSYPMQAFARNEAYDLLEQANLLDNFDDLLQPETQERIAAQDYSDLLVTADGVMFADGAMWMANVCLDETCSETTWAIITLNDDSA